MDIFPRSSVQSEESEESGESEEEELDEEGEEGVGVGEAGPEGLRHGGRLASTPASPLSWAARSRDLGDAGSGGGPEGDSRRQDAGSIETPTVTIENLARLFSRIVKAMSDVSLGTLGDADGGLSGAAVATVGLKAPTPGHMADPGGLLMRQAVSVMRGQMERTWQWLCATLDALEAQLRTGVRFLAANENVETDYSELRHTRRPSRRKQSQRARDDPAQLLGRTAFQQYLLSIMRAHSGEHFDTMPALDVSQCRYIAYALDAYTYFLRTQQRMAASTPALSSTQTARQPRSFFMRSESIVVGGAVAEAEFTTPMKVALPLAERPDRLNPEASRASLFGDDTRLEGAESARTPSSHLGLSNRLSGGFYDVAEGGLAPASAFTSPLAAAGGELGMAAALMSPNMTMSAAPSVPMLGDLGLDAAATRWARLLDLFAQLFLGDVGGERESFLGQVRHSPLLVCLFGSHLGGNLHIYPCIFLSMCATHRWWASR